MEELGLELCMQHEGEREGGLDGNWLILCPYSLSTLPPFPSMRYRIKLLHEDTSHTGPPMGHCADELNRLVNHPTCRAQLGCRRCGVLSGCLTSHSTSLI